MISGILVRMMITALGLAAAAWLIPGVVVDGPQTLIFAALLLGIVNALVRPIAVILTLPLTIMTLGLFLFVINAAMFGLVAKLLSGFVVTGFMPALLGWLTVWLTSWIASSIIGPNGKYQIVERR